MRCVYLDTEFIKNNLSASGLISIGLYSDGLEYYAVHGDMDVSMQGLSPSDKEWMVANVWPHLPGGHPDTFDHRSPQVKSYASIRDDVDRFFRSICPSGDAYEDVTLYANCGSQDVVRLHGLWDHDWSVMPSWIPQFADDMARIKRVMGGGVAVPEQRPESMHHALEDARHEASVHQFLLSF